MNMDSYSCCDLNTQEFQKISSTSSLLKLLGEESRLKILCILRRGPHCVCEMMERVCLSQSLISHHLKDLKEAGIVEDDKRGLKVFYSLTDQGRELSEKIFNL